MVTLKARDYIRGVSPFQEKAKKRKPVKEDPKVDICLECDKEDCKKGYCERMKR